jgi:hypothetical protein
MAENRNTYKILVGKPKEKRPLVRPTCRWKANIKMDLKIYDGRVWIRLAWLRIGIRSRTLWIQ